MFTVQGIDLLALHHNVECSPYDDTVHPQIRTLMSKLIHMHCTSLNATNSVDVSE